MRECNQSRELLDRPAPSQLRVQVPVPVAISVLRLNAACTFTRSSSFRAPPMAAYSTAAKARILSCRLDRRAQNHSLHASAVSAAERGVPV
jgi:hypothetical protein